jgi:hypothetical protein
MVISFALRAHSNVKVRVWVVGDRSGLGPIPTNLGAQAVENAAEGCADFGAGGGLAGERAMTRPASLTAARRRRATGAAFLVARDSGRVIR